MLLMVVHDLSEVQALDTYRHRCRLVNHEASRACLIVISTEGCMLWSFRWKMMMPCLWPLSFVCLLGEVERSDRVLRVSYREWSVPESLYLRDEANSSGLLSRGCAFWTLTVQR